MYSILIFTAMIAIVPYVDSFSVSDSSGILRHGFSRLNVDSFDSDVFTPLHENFHSTEEETTKSKSNARVKPQRGKISFKRSRELSFSPKVDTEGNETLFGSGEGVGENLFDEMYEDHSSPSNHSSSSIRSETKPKYTIALASPPLCTITHSAVNTTSTSTSGQGIQGTKSFWASTSGIILAGFFLLL